MMAIFSVHYLISLLTSPYILKQTREMLTCQFRQEKIERELDFSNYMETKGTYLAEFIKLLLPYILAPYFNKADKITQGSICELHVLIVSIQVKVKHI